MTDTIRQKIAAWARSAEVPDWQSTAFRLIYEQGELFEGDVRNLGLLLRHEHGIAVELGNLPFRRFDAGGLDDGTSAPVSVRLISLGKLSNVNAIAPGEMLKFQPKGITIVYGPNGSGKSGYSRVLKRACYARDSYAQTGDEHRILPNQLLPHNGELASAEFTLSVDGKLRTPIHWQDGERIADKLQLSNSPISVFDSHAADVYVVGDNQIPFSFYGLDIMEKLAELCGRLRESVGNEINANHETLKVLWEFRDDVEIGEIIRQLHEVKNHSTPPAKEEIGKIRSSFSQDKRERLEYLRKLFEEKDPVKTADELRKDITRITEWKQKVVALADELDNKIRPALQKAICEFSNAENFAHEEMGKLGGVIHGSGGLLWHELFKAAEKFSKEPYPEGNFPDVEKCVLCQQRLPDSYKWRLSQLKEFVRRGAGAIREEKKQEVERIRNIELRGWQISNILSASLLADIERVASVVGSDFSALEAGIRKFIVSMEGMNKHMTIAANDFDWKSPPLLSDNPAMGIEDLCKKAEKIAADLKNRAEKKDEKNQLEAKSAFVRHYFDVVKHISLWRCWKDADSKKISLKKKALTEGAINNALVNALRIELANLGMLAGVEFSMNPKQEKAKQKAQIRQGEIIGKKLRRVLSEGEHRTVALASFLAELSLSPNTVSSIVLDDPVSSLDHVRVHKVVERLRQEGKTRQVIIFTHDLYFSNLFNESEATKIAVRAEKDDSGNNAYGFVGKMPFHGIKAAAQINVMRQKAAQINNLHGEQRDGEIRSQYGVMQAVLEHIVEACLLNGIVARRFPDVKMQCLPNIFTHSDEKEKIAEDINSLSAKAKRIASHRYPSEGAGDSLTLDELKVDIERIDDIRKKLAELGSDRGATSAG